MLGMASQFQSTLVTAQWKIELSAMPMEIFSLVRRIYLDLLFDVQCLFLLVPQHGALRITTEFGRMLVKPEEICVIQVFLLPVLNDSYRKGMQFVFSKVFDFPSLLINHLEVMYSKFSIIIFVYQAWDLLVFIVYRI